MALAKQDLVDELDRQAAIVLGADYSSSTFRAELKAGLLEVIARAVTNWLTGAGDLPGAEVSVTVTGNDSNGDTHNLSGSGTIS